ncbi:hypothetical protein JAK23_10825 [Stenotrophomonas maltophilia]|uniref:hypothetical protein n=1 Tax=Stenotrophomonas maltophilia TaxID=40324 RepID=UPI0021C69A64|nr:hypothetical protein [Stenotrophomonas maltophilia]MBN5149974.1 hypothetical protein [Stenotrophomonas maltophilia]MCU1196166.1 hypothetical protein [Stenotrophomonas maltophilia]
MASLMSRKGLRIVNDDNPRLVETGGGPPHDGGMEARVAKLESTLEYVQRDVAEIRADLKKMADQLNAFGKDVNGEFRAIRAEAKTDFRLLFGALITVALGLAGLMAKGFGWI